MTRFKVSFDGIMDALEELERENHRLRAMIAEQQEKIAALEEDKHQLVAGFQAVNADLRLKSMFN